VGNRLGWRLPMLQELASLVDATLRFGLTLPVHPYSNVRSSIPIGRLLPLLAIRPRMVRELRQWSGGQTTQKQGVDAQ
jgi:hypothetical protein